MCQRLASDLLPLVPSLTPGEMAQCATSFAFLRWLNVPLFEALVQVSRCVPTSGQSPVPSLLPPQGGTMASVREA